MKKNKQIIPDLKSKIFFTVFAAVFTVMCLLPVISMPFGLNGSGAEKRQLSKMPDIVGENGLNLEFTSQFDTFFSENFGQRSNYITMYANIAYALTGDSVNKKVTAGKDGWLFYYETLSDYTGAKVLSQAELNCLYRILFLQNEYVTDNDADFIFMAVPNKNSIYPEYMPDRYAEGKGESSLEKLEKLLEENDFPCISLLSSLKAVKSEELLYHKKDTHWNNYGAMSACNALLSAIENKIKGYGFKNYENLNFETSYIWQGDLDTMLFPASNKKDLQYTFDVALDFKYAKPMRTYEDILIETESEANDTRILMFRDSFANAMIPYISNAFGKATYSRSIPYDYTLLEKADPDVVVLEIAERNLGDILLKAPLMDSPVRNNVQADIEISRQVKANVETYISGKYTVFSGDLESFDPGEESFEIYIGLFNENGGCFYEAFPLITMKGESEAKGTRKNSFAYSACIETKDLQPGDHELQLQIKVGENYIRPEFEGVPHYIAPEE
ncbi:MAG: hypothetical protein PHX37_05150 [Eubacteriales bacterium]|nr:hypothetical protein [Eubacteriales bacterium]